jgi:MoxR-like ATPase
MVLATRNPIEQEGTYPLPEAQLDRFLMHVVITYPDEATEGEIIKLNRGENAQKPKDHARSRPGTAAGHPRRARRDRRRLRLGSGAEIYRRHRSTPRGSPAGTAIPSANGSRSAPARAAALRWIAAPACVPGSTARIRHARPCARVMHDCLRHRLILSYEAVSQGINADQVIDKITELVSRRVRSPWPTGPPECPGVYVISKICSRSNIVRTQGLLLAAPAGAQPVVGRFASRMRGPRD